MNQMAKRKQTDISSPNTSHSPLRSNSTKRGKNPSELLTEISDIRVRSTRAKSSSKVQSSYDSNINTNDTKSKLIINKSNKKSNLSIAGNNNDQSLTCSKQKRSFKCKNNKQLLTKSKDKINTSSNNSVKNVPKISSGTKCKSKSTNSGSSNQLNDENYSNRKIDGNTDSQVDDIIGMSQQIDTIDEDTKRIQETEAALRSLTGDIINTETDTEDVEETDKPMFENLFAKKDTEIQHKTTSDYVTNAWKDVVTLSASSSSCGSLSDPSPHQSPANIHSSPETPDGSSHDDNINYSPDSRTSISTISENNDQTLNALEREDNFSSFVESKTNEKSSVSENVDYQQKTIPNSGAKYDEMENLLKIEEQCAFIQSNKNEKHIISSFNEKIDRNECNDGEGVNNEEGNQCEAEDEDGDNRCCASQRFDSTLMVPLATHLLQPQKPESHNQRSTIQQSSHCSSDILYIKEENIFTKNSCCLQESPQNQSIKAQHYDSSNGHTFAAFKTKAPERKYFDCKYQKSVETSSSCHSPPNYMSTKESLDVTTSHCHQPNVLSSTPLTSGMSATNVQYLEEETMTSTSNLSFPGSPPTGNYFLVYQIFFY
jgi:hypothetical protein